MSKQFSADDVAQHNKEGNAYIIIEDGVYDISKFAALHPGGKGVILGVAGQDATEQFWQFHNKAILKKYEKRLRIGTVSGSAKQETPKAKSEGEQQKKNEAAQQINQQAKHQAATTGSRHVFKSEPYGDKTPYGEPNYMQGWASPYYSESHKKYQQAVREWVDEEVTPNVNDWDEAKAVPKDIWKKCAEAGILAGSAGPEWKTQWAGSKIAGGVKPEEFDAFHEQILVDEMCHAGSGGATWGIIAGISIGLPPVMYFAEPKLRDRVCTDVMRGEKVICLAITEPSAGSDVANLTTTAKLSEDGKHYIVNGEKKWITNGIYADYFTVAVRTGGKGHGGISMLLVERSEGVKTTQMKCQGMWSSGTTYVTFENVKVPVSNLLGKENEGFKAIMVNFNHERWGTIIQASRFSRVLLAEAMAYSFKRKTFGKRLIDHPVIRLKLAHMARQVESTHAWLENVTYQMTTLSKAEQTKYLAGPIALLKAQATVSMEFCAREASQIFGGLAYTRGGQGGVVERLYREVRAYAIPAGSEEIMLDLGIKQAVKNNGGKI